MEFNGYFMVFLSVVTVNKNLNIFNNSILIEVTEYKAPVILYQNNVRD